MLSTLRRPAAAAAAAAPAAAAAAAAAPPGLSRNLGPSSLYSSLLPPLLFASFSDSLEQTERDEMCRRGSCLILRICSLVGCTKLLKTQVYRMTKQLV